MVKYNYKKNDANLFFTKEANDIVSSDQEKEFLLDAFFESITLEELEWGDQVENQVEGKAIYRIDNGIDELIFMPVKKQNNSIIVESSKNSSLNLESFAEESEDKTLIAQI